MLRSLWCGLFILGAAHFTEAQPGGRIDFARDVAPLLEQHCVRCHHAGTASSNLQMTSRRELIRDRTVVPGKPDESLFYQVIAGGSMPPGRRFDAAQVAVIRAWIQEGASWPESVTLKSTPDKTGPAVSPPAGATAEQKEVHVIRERILAHQASEGTKMAPYKVTIPGSTVGYEMVPIPAGEFRMGANGNAGHSVRVSAFWMQSHEVTWDEYRLFMFANQAGEIAHKDELVDGVSRPTRPYVEMSFGMGINGFPAISMTQHAANKYAEWLSAKTGEFYRLPTEAEWEYACKAGSAGDNPAALADSAWYAANSGGAYHKVATKKPNAWGLFDMLGNVMEWTLDQYAPYPAGPQVDPWVKPSKPYPIAVRGGSWNDAPELLTCEARVASDPAWKQQDPQLPKSIWYETDAQWLGFRLVRPQKVPEEQQMFDYWNNRVEHDEQ
jgi:formylglycine-generating enzyme required for sulfatase activity